MQRPNLFALTNQGLRRELYLAAARLQHTDLGNEAAHGIIRQLEIFLTASRALTRRRAAFIEPYLVAASGRIARQHRSAARADTRLCTDLLDCLQRWRSAADARSKSLNGSKLLYDFNEYVAYCLSYMNRQESTVVQALRSRYTNDELDGIAAAWPALQGFAPEGGFQKLSLFFNPADEARGTFAS